MIKCQLKSKVLNLCSEGYLTSVVWEAEPYLPTLGCEKEGDHLFNLNKIGGKYQSGAQKSAGSGGETRGQSRTFWRNKQLERRQILL